MGWLVGFVSWCCLPLSLPAPAWACDLGLAVQEPLINSGLDVLRGGVHVEVAFAGLLEVVGTFSAELLVLVKGIVSAAKDATAAGAVGGEKVGRSTGKNNGVPCSGLEKCPSKSCRNKARTNNNGAVDGYILTDAVRKVVHRMCEDDD